MPPNSDRGSADDVVRKIEATLASMRGDVPGSWLKRIFNPASRQRDFNRAVLSVLAETVAALRETASSQEAQLEQLRSLLAERSTELGSEMRERIQHLLDEQRVCLRQISLQTSEETVLADRTRRDLERRMDELTRRLPEQPA